MWQNGTGMNQSCHTCERVLWHIGCEVATHGTRMNELCHTCERVMSHTDMRHVAHVSESRHTYE